MTSTNTPAPPAPPAAHGGDASRRGFARPPVRLAVPAAIVVLGCVGASLGNQAQIGTWGLVQALPPLYFASLAALTVSFFVELFRRKGSSSAVLVAHLVGLVLLLHGAPGFLEQEPRFATAWLHAGFSNQILDHHLALSKVDARFNWPGFFSSSASVVGTSGLTSAVSFLRWAPIFMVLLYLPPIYLIGKHLTGSATAAWLGLWLFLSVNWVGQDYFAPQSFGFILYLVALAILVCFFRDGDQISLGAHVSAWRARLPYDGLADVAVDRRTRAALVILLILIAGAAAMSHQLSPIALVLASSVLVLVGRSRLLFFPVIAGILTLGWISVGTTDYWVGHLDVIFGGLGDLSSVLGGSVSERIGGSAGHLAVVGLRLQLTAAVWILMLIAALVLSIQRRPPLTLLALGLVPFLTLAQSYGDEGVLRVFLLSSPFACLIVAQLVVKYLQHRSAQVVTIIVALALLPLFLVTRYGNEAYEQTRANEVQAVRELGDLAPPGSNLLSPTSQVPWRFERVGDYDYSRPIDAEGFLKGVAEAVQTPVAGSSADAPATYLIVTTSQIIYASEALGASPDWFETVRPLLTPENGYTVVYENPDAVIYKYEVPQ